MSAKRNGSGDEGWPHIMNAQQTADYLKVSLSLLAHWRLTREGPAFHRYGTGRRAVIRYLRTDLDTFQRGSRIGGTDA